MKKDDATGLPYLEEAAKSYRLDDLHTLLSHYYRRLGAPLGEDGAGIWIHFEQWTRKN